MSATVCVLGLLQRATDAATAPAGDARRESALRGCAKGANQAVAASRLGAHVTLVGAVTDDDDGRALRGALAAEGIDLAHVTASPRARGEASVSAADVEQAWSAIAAADVLLVQGELPPEVTLHALWRARDSGTLVLYEAVPARALPDGFLGQVDLLVTRPAEAAELLADASGEIGHAGLVRRMASLGPERVVLSLGADGAYLFDGERLVHVEPCAPPRATAAGAGVEAPGTQDAFVAALAVLRAEGARLREAVRHACAARALAAEARGVAAAFPQRDALEGLARRRKGSRAS